MKLELDGKRAFVSGSTQGIGYAIAKSLLEEGAAVVINGRSVDKLSAAISSLESAVPDAAVSGLVADFGDSDQVEKLLTELGEVDILVNNVGIFDLTPFAEITDEDWREYLEVNLMSGVRLARRLIGGMLAKDWGRILFISSESGVNVPVEMIHYGTTKAAMLALGNGLAKLTRGTGVTVNTILGGPTYSDGVAEAIDQLARSQAVPVDQLKAAIIGGTPTSLLQRFIEPAEIANLAVFLASPLSAAMNGSALRADGGALTSIL